jgi:hypothetical protein
MVSIQKNEGKLYLAKFFCRGTKGDNGSAKDLGGAKKVKGADGKEVMEVELPTAREDVDSLWSASQSALRQKPPAMKEHRGECIYGKARWAEADYEGLRCRHEAGGS